MGHTKGPWVTQKLERTNHPYAKERGMLEPYRILATPDSGCEEVAIIDGQDDARLIAAAPDLLAALVRVRLDLICEHGTRIYEANFGYIDAAITKATAQQVDEMRVQEIAELRRRIDQLEREKRGIGPEDQYA